MPSVVFLIVITLHAGGQKNEGLIAFAKLIDDPVPSSVQIVSFGKLRGIGESRVVLQFTISAEDLMNVTGRTGYKLEEDFERDIGLWTQQIKTATGIAVDVRTPCRHYVARSRNAIKHLFYNADQGMAFLWVVPG